MKNVERNIVTYEPDNSIRKGYGAVFREIVVEIIDNRWLTYQLFKRDFLTAYKQSFLGILWAFIVPFASVGLFALLNRSGVFSVGALNVPYPIYALLGMSFWQLFSTGISSGSGALVRAGSMIVQINFSKKSLIIASSGQALVSFLIQFSLVLLLFALYRIPPSAAILLLPLIMLPLLLLTLGLGLIMAIFNGILRDTGTVLSMGLTFLMFLTPVLYTRPKTGILPAITKYNPLYYMVAGARDLILTGVMPEQSGFIVSSALSLAVFIFGLIIFHLTETRITERV